MGSARFGNSSARAPEIAAQDKHGSGNRPAEKNFAVATDALVSEDAMGASMGAFLDQIDDSLVTARPKESHANAEKCLADAKVTAGRAASMEDVDDEAGRREEGT